MPELKEADGTRLAREALQSVTHDIKTIITPFKPCIGEVMENAGADAYLRSRVARIERGLKDLENLLKDIDAFARPIEIDTQMESITEIVAEAIETAQKNLLAKGRDSAAVKVEVKSSNPVRIPISRYHIHMALTNLIKNAIESHAEDRTKFRDGTVTITIRKDAQGAHIQIADSGGGLSPKELAKLQDFVPGHSAKSGTGGTGYNPVIAAYVQGLRDRGKPYKCAIVAAMRKLLIHIQSLMKKVQLSPC